MILKESFDDTGEKVSLKSIPSFCVYPLATNLALNRSMLPLESFLVLNTHLQPIGLKPFGISTSSYTPLEYIDLISSYMASIHLSDCLQEIASL